MGNLCVKPQNSAQYVVQEIDFHALFEKELVSPNGDNYFQLLNFLTKADVKCLVYIVKALFQPTLKNKIVDLVISIAQKVDTTKPPVHLLKRIKQRQMGIEEPHKTNAITIKSIHLPTTKISNNYDPYRCVDEVFSRSSCPIQNQKDESFQINPPGYVGESNKDLMRKEREIEERLEKLSEALRGAQRAYEIERQCVDRQSQSRSSFISRASKRSPNRTMRNIMDTSERIYTTSFHSISPKNNTLPKKSLEQITLDLKKSHTDKQLIQVRNQVQLEAKISNSNLIPIFEPDQCPAVDKYMEIREFYEGQIAKYRQQLEYLRNRLVISQKENQSSERSKVFSSLVSKDSKSSIINRERTLTMKICSGQVNQEIKQEITDTVEYGTKMTEVENSHISSELQSNNSDRKHAKSLIIRLFRDSKMFPIEYSKRSSPVKFIETREKFEQMFSVFYTQKVYMRNPIQCTNMIFLYEDRQPKKFIDYLKDYRAWILIGKVNENLCIGAFINLKSGPKSSTQQCFLFSLPKQGSPLILRAKNKIMDPMTRPQYINFGDSEFRIKSGTKKVNLGLDNLNMNFLEEDGSEPNIRRFTQGQGQNIQLQQLEIHQVVFADDSW